LSISHTSLSKIDFHAVVISVLFQAKISLVFEGFAKEKERERVARAHTNRDDLRVGQDWLDAVD
jgi:hypothetical protein